jgi:hypothetical protein
LLKHETSVARWTMALERLTDRTVEEGTLITLPAPEVSETKAELSRNIRFEENPEELTSDDGMFSAERAPALGGATDIGKVTAIDLEKSPDGFSLQRLVFQAARKAFAELSHGFTGTQEYLAAQLVRIVEALLNSDRLDIPSLFHFDQLRRRILNPLNIDP